MIASSSYSFDPLLSPVLLTGFLVFSFCFAFYFYKKPGWPRLLAYGFLTLCVLNPVRLDAVTKPISDVVLLAFDRSASQSVLPRPEQISQAQQTILQSLENKSAFDVRVVSIDGEEDTRIFEKLENAFSDVPKNRRAGIILVTDGQIHDVPKTLSPSQFGPLHVLLTGRKNEKDRRLTPLATPAFGIVGKTAIIKLRLDDPDLPENTSIPMTVNDGSGEPYLVRISPKKDVNITTSINHPGENIITFSIPVSDHEISTANNTLAISIKGVRDRLKVLLVSGEPHAGGRLWRDMLRADPAIDLVHFTILRNPDSIDLTPRHELSLIPFPFQELFEEKLTDFDLIIFDRYRKNDIMPDLYYKNIVDYVKNGGAFLEVSGPSYAGPESIFSTPLEEILPGAPTHIFLNGSFKPTITDKGMKHPVLLPFAGHDKNWGPWLNVNKLNNIKGDILLQAGEGGPPLLILNKVDKGRIAQLASDEVWLWSRGYKGGGPAIDLFRRVAHWLMKEPSLEEQFLSLSLQGKTLVITQENAHNPTPPLNLTYPDGRIENLGLIKRAINRSVSEPGIYTLSDGVHTSSVIVGMSDSLEYRNLLSTPDILAPFVLASRGTVRRLDGNAIPDIRAASGRNATYGGDNWIGLKASNSTQTIESRQTPIVPALAWLFILIPLFGWMWWHEAGKKIKSAS